LNSALSHRFFKWLADTRLWWENELPEQGKSGKENHFFLIITIVKEIPRY